MNIHIPSLYFLGDIELHAWNPSGNGLEVVGVEFSPDRVYWEPMRKSELPRSIIIN